ncbi:MAG TPA: NAD(P)-dependent oxidoreductase [Burkholderiales bacterium]|nr:NAD(P)-dependent oxidoreductase [Burkholderiales bacterium]
MARVGVIGAGLMGTAVTKRLVAAGFEVLAYDVDADKRRAIEAAGAQAQSTAGLVIAGCEISVLCVFNTDQVETVIAGPGGGVDAIAQGGTGARVFVVTSTCDPERLAALARRVSPEGARVVEAPISGTSRQVANGDGVFLIGGEREHVERASAVLDAICPKRHYLGAAGNGSRAKLAVNLILGLNRAALAEGLVFAQALGLDPVAFLNVARGSAAYSQVMDVKGELMARREFTQPQSRIDQSLKDFTLMLEQAHAKHQGLPFASVYVRMLEDCIANGEGEWDNAAIAAAIARLRAP